jgi:hypothetical protein
MEAKSPMGFISIPLLGDSADSAGPTHSPLIEKISADVNIKTIKTKDLFILNLLYYIFF